MYGSASVIGPPVRHVVFVHLCDTLRAMPAAGSRVCVNVTSLRHVEGSLIVP